MNDLVHMARGGWWGIRLLPAFALALVAVLPVPAAAAPRPAISAATNVSDPTGGSYTALEPYRVLDTRVTPNRLGANSSLDVQVTGVSGPKGQSVPAGASAVVLNAAAVAGSAGSYLTLYPTGATQRPLASNLNFGPGQTIANLVMVKLSAQGKVSVYNSQGAVDVLLDVQGWYSSTSAPAAAGRFVALTQPQRLLDTRQGSGPLGPNSVLSLPIVGNTGLPASGLIGAVLNVTAVAPTEGTYLTVYPAGAPVRPEASNVNVPAGRNLPNRVLAKVGDGGSVSIYNSQGAIDVVVDVSGYFGDGSSGTGLLFNATTPFRILDTRQQGGPLGGDQSLDLVVPSAGAGAAALNVTAVNPSTGSFLTVFPADSGSRPLASDLNLAPGDVLPNLVVVKLGSGDRIRIYNNLGSVHLLVDVLGWYGGTPLPDWPELINTPWDHVPDLAAHPNIWSVASGPWSAASTWSAGRTPHAGDVVGVEPGTLVDYDVVSDERLNAVSVHPGGALRFRTDANTRLATASMQVLAGASLEIGTEASPVQALVRAELVIGGAALDLGRDPDQYGDGLLVWGRVSMWGATRSPSFSRLATLPHPGDSSLQAADALNWAQGDRVVVAQSTDAAYVDTSEVRVLAGAASGGSLSLTSALQYDHPGGHDGAGAVSVLPGGAGLLPHVADLNRNVVVRSPDPGGVRGHTFFTYRAEVDMGYVLFKDMGRTQPGTLDPSTNHIGRYVLHLHHLWGPAPGSGRPYQFRLVGDVVDGGMKWGVAVHDSHFGLVQNNVVYQVKRAGIVTEDGSESHNLFDHNIVMNVSGGDGYWLNGIRNLFRNNVAAGIVQAEQMDDDGFGGGGFYFPRNILSTSTVKQPLVPGGDLLSGDPSQVETVAFADTNMTEFDHNEAYASFQAVWLDHRVGAADHHIDNQLAWVIRQSAVLNYGSINGLVIDNLIAREASLELWAGGTALVRNANIQAAPGPGILDVRNVFSPGMELTVQNSYLRNAVNVEFDLAAQMDAQPIWPETIHRLTLDNVRMDAQVGSPPSNVVLSYHNTRWGDTVIPVVRNEFVVRGYNGVAGDDFRVYFREQAPDFVVPYTGDLPDEGQGFTHAGAPERGLTNAVAWSRYQVAIAGSVAPCTGTRPAITGFVCAGGASPAQTSRRAAPSSSFVASSDTAGQAMPARRCTDCCC